VDRVSSADGTEIAYERSGRGPAVILVGGALDDGSENAELVPALAQSFTVYNYTRRGRGKSTDAQPYAVHREIEDIHALLTETGGSAHLFGASSGGALVLEAAAAGVAASSLVVYDVPYSTDDDAVAQWQQYRRSLSALLAEDRRDEALALFMRLAGSSEDDVEGAENSPYWPGLQTLAPTLAYDAACLGDGGPATARLATITQPTLVVTRSLIDPHTGGLQPGFFDAAADAIAAAVPNGERRIVESRSHAVEPTVVGPVLEQFFTGQRRLTK
jgi:pimeloyl-ACP methyl ester carboxylesterase